MTSTLDTWIIEKVYEPLSHRIEAWTGINNFMLSRFVLTGWLAAAGVNAIINWSAMYFTLLGVAILVCMLCAYNATTAERDSKRLGVSAASVWRHHPFNRGFRYLWLGFTFADIFVCVTTLSEWHRLLGSVGFGSHLYLICCSPMPPSYKQELAARHLTPEAVR